MNEKPQCPVCRCLNSLDDYAHGWTYCNGCGARVLLDVAGHVLRVIFARQHSGLANN